MLSQFQDLLPVFLIAITLWLAGLSVSFYWLINHYRRLFKGVKKDNLVKIIDNLIDKEEKNRKNVSELRDEIERVDREAIYHIQKLGLVRFNPFKEIGGDQSFALGLLNNDDTGFILTCLHTRDRTRVYAKPIVKGKSKYELSEEEKRALKIAQKQ